jgi:VWFA-related protein
LWGASAALFLAIVTLSAQQQPQQVPAGQKPPVFRGGANLVQVDVYPTREGQIVEGLTAADFQVFEDGKQQAVDSLEFIRIEPNTPDAFRRDPNTQEEGNQLAADPRNRVFVIYLDYYHTNITGSYSTQRPLVDFLNRMLAPNDLFGVMTPKLRPRDLILGRQTVTLEEQLAKYWYWGDRTISGVRAEDDELLYNCMPIVIPPIRRRMDLVLSNLEGLMTYLGNLREARKVVVILTGGWHLLRRDEAAANAALGKSGPGVPGIGVDPRGRITTNPDPSRGMGGDKSGCASEAYRLYTMDFEERMRDLIAVANRNNVTFYPLNPAGLEAPDVMNAPSAGAAMGELRMREDSVRTLAGATDGTAIMTNDLRAGFRRISDDVSAYYVLGYYSTNLKFDGRYRNIEVKMKPPGLRVKARRGYFAPAENTGSAARPGVATPAAAKEKTPVDEAFATLSRLRPSAEIYSHGAAGPAEIAVAVELPAMAMIGERWAKGADVQVSVAESAGAAVGTAQGRIEPGTRGVSVRIPIPTGSAGPWRVTSRVTGAGETLQDRIDIARPTGTLAGEALVFRAQPSGQSPLRAVADMQFRRTERLHIEWLALGALDRREARLLGKNGSPIPVPVSVTEREVNGQAMIAADLNLAPLTEADYVIELTVGRGPETERKLIGIRVVR